MSDRWDQYSRDELERVVTDYAAELDRLCEFVQSRHWAGKTKYIGRREAVQAAIELLTEQGRPQS